MREKAESGERREKDSGIPWSVPEVSRHQVCRETRTLKKVLRRMRRLITFRTAVRVGAADAVTKVIETYAMAIPQTRQGRTYFAWEVFLRRMDEWRAGV